MLETSALLQGYFGMSPQVAESLLSQFDSRQLLKSEHLFKKHRHAVPLAFIDEGFIRIYDIHNGKEVTQWISGPGDMITDILGLVFDQPNRWNAQALTPVKISYLSHAQYKKLDQVIPQWKALENQFMAKCFRILEERVYSFLSLSAKDRHKLFVDQHPALVKHIPQQYVASILGVSPETLSRIRSSK